MDSVRNYPIQAMTTEMSVQQITIFPGTWGQTLTCDMPMCIHLPDGTHVDVPANAPYVVPMIPWERLTHAMQEHAREHSLGC